MRTRKGLARSTSTLLAAGLLLVGTAMAATAQDHDHDGPNMADEPDSFTSMFSVEADADQVVSEEHDGGEPGATGRFDLRLDADTDTICFDITLDGVTPPYESPANTATHIHEAPAGEAGPPRVVFPDPEMHDDGTLTSSGCVTGPWMTGVGPDDGGDHGEEFSVAALEADPSAFYVDTHTTDYIDGAVRGQFGSPVPMEGMETGDGTAGASSTALMGMGLAGLAGLVTLIGTGTVLRRRQQNT